jgi:prevent-host-death family protein
VTELTTVGVRELRNQVAAVVRRAEAGERLVVTVDGRPACQLGPLSPPGRPSLADLVGAGLVVPPAGAAHRDESPPTLVFATDTRPDRLLRDVRGR